MELHAPFIITARLAPGLKIGDTYLSLLGVGMGKDPHRNAAKFVIDFPDGTSYEDDRMQSGCGGFRGVVSIFENFLGFLGAAIESMGFEERTGLKGENTDLFPLHVLKHMQPFADDIACLEYDLQEEGADQLIKD